MLSTYYESSIILSIPVLIHHLHFIELTLLLSIFSRGGDWGKWQGHRAGRHFKARHSSPIACLFIIPAHSLILIFKATNTLPCDSVIFSYRTKNQIDYWQAIYWLYLQIHPKDSRLYSPYYIPDLIVWSPFPSREKGKEVKPADESWVSSCVGEREGRDTKMKSEREFYS